MKFFLVLLAILFQPVEKSVAFWDPGPPVVPLNIYFERSAGMGKPQIEKVLKQAFSSIGYNIHPYSQERLERNRFRWPNQATFSAGKTIHCSKNVRGHEWNDVDFFIYEKEIVFDIGVFGVDELTPCRKKDLAKLVRRIAQDFHYKYSRFVSYGLFRKKEWPVDFEDELSAAAEASNNR